MVSRPPSVEPQARKNKTSAWRPKLRPQAATQLKFQVGLAFLLVSLLLFSSCQQSAETGSKALSPEASLATFRLPEDLRVEIFAAEPYVRDPVDLVFDEEGRAFVAEMLDYPYDPPRGEPPRSRIRALEDRDGDGRVDHSVVFADGILQLKGLLPWNGGIIAAAAPDLLFFKDTDGDLRADERKVLFTGFEVGQPQGRVSNLRFSLDNWIYVSNDGHPGDVIFSGRPDAAAVSVLGTDFRFRLDRGLFESASGAARFGQTLDAWGHRFVTEPGPTPSTFCCPDAICSATHSWQRRPRQYRTSPTMTPVSFL